MPEPLLLEGSQAAVLCLPEAGHKGHVLLRQGACASFLMSVERRGAFAMIIIDYCLRILYLLVVMFL